MTPYREAPKRERPKSQTLECLIATGDKYGGYKAAAIKTVAVVVAVIAAQVVDVIASIVVAALGFVWIVWGLGRGNRRLTIRVDGERVFFGLPQPLDVSFAKLLDVRLDTKTTTKALNHARADGLNSMFGPVIPDGRSIQVDQSRIELVVKGREPVLLMNDRISSTLAHENIREIKVFLRKAGWLPVDERPLEDRPKKKKKTPKTDDQTT